MIILNTHRSEIYCKIIHSYLEVEIFGDSEIDIGDTIEWTNFINSTVIKVDGGWY